MPTSSSIERRIRRELKTVKHMLDLHCRDRHEGKRGLCGDCGELWGYVQARVELCPFRDDKPTCANCTVHCYKPEMREKIRSVMRYAGPRMLKRHPILTILHLIEGRKPGRELPKKRPQAPS
jgi:hypothetical protein